MMYAVKVCSLKPCLFTDRSAQMYNKYVYAFKPYDSDRTHNEYDNDSFIVCIIYYDRPRRRCTKWSCV